MSSDMHATPYLCDYRVCRGRPRTENRVRRLVETHFRLKRRGPERDPSKTRDWGQKSPFRAPVVHACTLAAVTPSGRSRRKSASADAKMGAIHAAVLAGREIGRPGGRTSSATVGADAQVRHHSVHRHSVRRHSASCQLLVSQWVRQ